MSALRTEFRPSHVKPNEQPEIIRLCNIAWKHDALKSSTEAIIYSAPRNVWWHNNPNDTREHITVRYNRRSNRVHVYRDGTVDVKPHKPTNMRLRGTAKAAEEDEKDYDSVSELSGEEFDEQ